ncbi:MAG TPA: BTAD domain-containing putative transcriptional regulator, partial [Ilumatobacteraceae bacterium]
MLFGVLGPLIVVDDGVDVTPNATQQRLLLAALVSAAPNAVAVDALADLLWPDGPPSGNALQVLVSKLRRALPSATITSGPAGYRFEPGPDDRIDVDQFEAAVRRGQRAAEAGDVDEVIGQYTDALALVRGRPLADIGSTEVGQAAAARLGGLVSGARTARLDALVGAGRLGDAGAELEALVAEDPLNEHWWALLMTVRARQGRPGDALRAFAEARRVLAEELGVEPGPELRTLERQVLEHDPVLAPPVTATRSARPHLTVHSLPARLSSLVGRDDLLDRLATDLDRQRLVTVVGPGGAGKTSIALELARRVAPSSSAFVELAPVDDPDSVATTVADVLGIAGADAPVP